MRQVHSFAPKCIEKHQHLYYNGCKDSSKFTNNDKPVNFYNVAKKSASSALLLLCVFYKNVINNTDK